MWGLLARRRELPSQSLSYSLRRIVKDKGALPNDEAISELLWLAWGKPRRSGSGPYVTGKPPQPVRHTLRGLCLHWTIIPLTQFSGHALILQVFPKEKAFTDFQEKRQRKSKRCFLQRQAATFFSMSIYSTNQINGL